MVMGTQDIERSVTFWSQALGYRVHRFPGEDDFVILIPPSGDGTRVALERSETPVQMHPRVHLDLVVDSADEQRTEIDRLVGLGAERVDWDLYPEDPDFVVLADTEGNRFCIVDASHG